MNRNVLTQPLLKAFVVFGAAASLLTSCESTDREAGWDEQTRIYNASEADAEMQEAMRQSRSTIGEFVKALNSSDSANHSFAVKYGFQDGDEQEFMWIGNLTARGDSLYGIVDNEPEYIHNVQVGQSVAIHKDSVADWNYTRHGRLMGGYSIRLIRNRMSPEERAEFDKSVRWKFD